MAANMAAKFLNNSDTSLGVVLAEEQPYIT